jgi:hypothetical protein
MFNKKYLKYKTKYLNLKAEIHNKQMLQTQMGGSTHKSIMNIDALTATPFSSEDGFVANKPLQNGGTINKADIMLLNALTESPMSSENNLQIGGKHKMNNKKKKKDSSESESDSDFESTDSSLLSFSSVEVSSSEE